MNAIERRTQLAAEMHELADFLGDTDDPQINHLPVSHWDLMATMLRAFCPKPAPSPVLSDPRISLPLVLSEVSIQMRVTTPAILSEDRKQRVSFARQVAMYLSRRLAKLSYPAIGMFFERDHSTVIHAELVIARRIECEPEFASTVEKLSIAIRCRAARVADAARKAA